MASSTVAGLCLATFALAGCLASGDVTGRQNGAVAAPSSTASGTRAPSSSATPTPAASEPSPPETSATAETAPSPSSPGAATTALEVLRTLPVKGRAPKTGYTRAQFGQAWADIDRNGCDQRNDTLKRDLFDSTFKPGTRDCVVLTGHFVEPYSGRQVSFVRGPGSSSAVQIDHVVALANAWVTGAQQWTPKVRETFANDPLVLLAADGPLNQQKGAGDAATWLPPNKAFRCAYVARQVAIKSKHNLWVTIPEASAIERVLRTCPSQTLPQAPSNVTSSPASTRPRATATSSRPAPARSTPRPTTPPSTGSRGNASEPAEGPSDATVEAPLVYVNCAAARAAGKTPLHTDDPGYSRRLDRDGDGVACE